MVKLVVAGNGVCLFRLRGADGGKWWQSISDNPRTVSMKITFSAYAERELFWMRIKS